MKITLAKDTFLKSLSVASRFSMTSLSSISLLTNGLLKFSDGTLEVITTNLNDFFQIKLKINNKKTESLVTDIKKIVEFLNFLPFENINIELKNNQLIIGNNKTQGVFSVMSAEEFPKLPQADGKKYTFKEEFFKKNLNLVIFAAARDENRPALTGTYFSAVDGMVNLVATDGFRLSLFREKSNIKIPPLVISSKVLNEVLNLITNDGVDIIVSENEKTLVFKFENINLFSRLIEEDFPPYEKVIPQNFTTKITLNKDEILRNVKLASVFARDSSNIITLDVRKDGLYIKPKINQENETTIFQEVDLEGAEQKISFNFKFIIDFLNNIDAKNIQIELTQSNAPAVFRIEGDDEFLHIIMPVRTDEVEA